VKKSKGLLFIVSAPSGAGKTSLTKEVLKRSNGPGKRPLNWSCSYTTRNPRPGEVHGQDYFFVSESDFDRMIQAGEFAEWAVVYGNKYGTSLRYLQEAEEKGIDLLLEIYLQGARQLHKRYGTGIFTFILPPSAEALRARLVKRGTEESPTIEVRLRDDRNYVDILRHAKDEVDEWDFFDYIIINDNFETAVETLEGIIFAERSRRERMNEAVEEILKDFHKED
jgi:guanylate kinase